MKVEYLNKIVDACVELERIENELRMKQMLDGPTTRLIVKAQSALQVILIREEKAFEPAELVGNLCHYKEKASERA
jgi:hypothetical protein